MLERHWVVARLGPYNIPLRARSHTTHSDKRLIGAGNDDVQIERYRVCKFRKSTKLTRHSDCICLNVLCCNIEVEVELSYYRVVIKCNSIDSVRGRNFKCVEYATARWICDEDRHLVQILVVDIQVDRGGHACRGCDADRIVASVLDLNLERLALYSG